MREGHQALCFTVLGQKADLGIMLLGPDLAALDRFAGELAGSPLGQALAPAGSYVSLTELSEYTPTEEDEAQRLAAEGLFAEERKRPLPIFPRRIGLVTSESGAVYHDVVTVLSRRFPIGTADEIKRSLLAARSVTYASDGASREHIERMFARLGIAAEMQAKTLLEQGSVRAAAKVVGGDAEILLTLVSEILPVEGMELIGPLPAEFQSYISFDAALGKRAADSADARALLSCVAAPATTSTFAAKGIER